MNDDVSFIAKLMALPPKMRQEVLHYIDFLLYKDQEQPNSQMPDAPSAQQRKEAGFSQVTFTMSADFDEPLDDFKEYMQ